MDLFNDLHEVQQAMATTIAGDRHYSVTDTSVLFLAKRAGRAGCVSALLRALIRHSNNPGCVVVSCMALSSINFRYRQNIAALIRADGLTTVLQIMTKHMSNATIIEYAMPLLSQMVIEDDSMFETAASAGAILVVGKVLHAHASGIYGFNFDFGWGSSCLIYKVICAVRYLTNLGYCEENVDSVVTAGIIEVTRILASRNEEDSNCQHQAFALFSELVRGRVSAAAPSFKAEGLTVIVRGMVAHVTCPEVQEFGCRALLSLSLVGHTFENEVSGVVKAIAAGMRANRDSEEVQNSALNALNYILDGDAEAKRVARENGVEFLVRVARTKYGHAVQGLISVCDEIFELVH